MTDSPKIEALQSLEQEDKLDAETLLSLAADPAHPCHDEFDWDDSRAAHQYRLGQAHKLIVRYRILRDDGDKQVSVRQFTYVPSQGRHLDGDRAVVDHMDELVEVARRDIRRFVAKHRRLGDERLSAIVEEVLAS